MKSLSSIHLPADPATKGAKADTLVILLPGAYNHAQDFIDAGFGQIAAQSRQRFDLVLPELDLGQLSSGEALPLLREQLIAPARASGVKKIWLGGVSLGGFNSLCFAEQFPNLIDGLCLLAPWPGSRISRNQIEAAGGLANWTPSAEQLATDPDFRVWQWIRRQLTASHRLPVFIGWGREERFAAGVAAYARAMPDAHIEVLPGQHDWLVWAQLWQRFCALDLIAEAQ